MKTAKQVYDHLKKVKKQKKKIDKAFKNTMYPLEQRSLEKATDQIIGKLEALNWFLDTED